MSRTFLCGAAWIGVAVAHASCADFEVINTEDAGTGSYRQAIEDANDNPGADRIVFNIPGSGVQTIQPLTPWPAFTEPIDVDGYTQPGAGVNTLSNGNNAVLLIQLDGVNLPSSSSYGVRLAGGSSTVRGLVINRFDLGLWLDSSSNRVTGNFIGPAPDGRRRLGNFDGLYFSPSCCHVIGGTTPADRNLISGNASHAFWIGDYDGAPVVDTVVLGNFIGTDVTGLARMSGGLSSTFTVRSAVNLTIGGLEPGAGNIIAAGARGVNPYFVTGNTRILGNSFGVAADGKTQVGDTNTQYAIWAHPGTWIEGNRIAFNAVGIILSPSVVMLRNLIYSNTVNGISGARTNDLAETDGFQNFPELAPTTDGVTLNVAGILRSKPNTTYTLEFFANPAPAASGYGEGESYLGSGVATTSAAGQAEFEVPFPDPGPGWSWISATATAPEGNTSMFCPTKVVRSATSLRIHSQPASMVVRPGTNLTLRADVSGQPPITYQWRRNGLDVPGATNATLTLLNLQPGQEGRFTVLLSNLYGILLTQPADVTLLVNPLFIQQPLSQTAAPGELITFSAAVRESATLPLSFGWRSNTTFIAATGPGPDTTSFLTIRAGLANATYGVVVTNAALPGGLGSASATLTIVSDRDHDGVPDAYETANGLSPDDPADAAVDADGDGLTSGQEYFAGTNPQDPRSALKVDRLSIGSDGVLLEFAAASNKTYSIRYSDSLQEVGWPTLTNLLASRSNRVVTVIDLRPAQQRFYRVATPVRP